MKKNNSFFLKRIFLIYFFSFLIACSVDEKPFFWVQEKGFNEDMPIRLWIIDDCKLESFQSQTNCYKNQEKIKGIWFEKEEKQQKGKTGYRLIEFRTDEFFSYGDRVDLKIKGVVQFERKQLIPIYEEFQFYYTENKILLLVEKPQSLLLESESAVCLSLFMPFFYIDFNSIDINKSENQSFLRITNSFNQETQIKFIPDSKSNRCQIMIQPIHKWQSSGNMRISIESDYFRINGDKEIEFFVQNRDRSCLKKAFWKLNKSNKVVFQLDWDNPIQIGELYSHCFFSPPIEGSWKKEEASSYYFIPTQLKNNRKEYRFTLLKGVKNLHTGLPSSDQIEKKNYPLSESLIPQIKKIEWKSQNQEPNSENLLLTADNFLKKNALYEYQVATEEALLYFRRIFIESNFIWDIDASNDLLNSIRIFPIMPDSGIKVPQKRLIGFTPDQKNLLLEFQFSKGEGIPFPVYYHFSMSLNPKHLKGVASNSVIEPISFYLKEVIK